MKSLRAFASIVLPVPDASPIRVRDLAKLLRIEPPISLRSLLTYKKITLDALICLKTESVLAVSDDCRLEVFPDGVLEMPLRKALANDELWAVNQSYLFLEEVKIKLWDEDTIDPDDLLGTVFIAGVPCETCVVEFTGDDAKYELHYHVEHVVTPDEFDPVQNEIELFRLSSMPGVWPNISKASLIGDLEVSVANPLNVRQDATPLCGPTSIVYELVARHGGFGQLPQKKRFVQLCRQLWETGQIHARSKTLTPSEDMRNSPLSPENNLSPADWLLIAGLRDVENVWNDVEAKVDGFEGYTFPGAMKGWIFEILGFDESDYDHHFFSGEMEAMKTAQEVWSKGGVAFLNIEANLLKTGRPSAGLLPNHWVPFLGGLEVDDAAETITFDCYSWGRRHHVAMKQTDFDDYMFGAVFGMREAS